MRWRNPGLKSLRTSSWLGCYWTTKQLSRWFLGLSTICCAAFSHGLHAKHRCHHTSTTYNHQLRMYLATIYDITAYMLRTVAGINIGDGVPSTCCLRLTTIYCTSSPLDVLSGKVFIAACLYMLLDVDKYLLSFIIMLTSIYCTFPPLVL